MRFLTSICLSGLMISGMLSGCSVQASKENTDFADPEIAQQPDATEEPTIVPQQERENAEQLETNGPTETSGIESLELLGTVDLSNEFDGLEGYTLRAREIVIAPGGQVAVHQHDSRPGVAYIIEGELIEGELIEHRNDQNEPIVRGAGDAAFEQTGVVHGWKNESSEPARALVVDIVPVVE